MGENMSQRRLEILGVEEYLEKRRKLRKKEKKEEQDYLFAYILDITPEKQAYVESMAKNKGLNVITKSADKNATLSVEDWFSMIANSSMVVTDSFHGTVFSIKYNKKFVSFIRDSNANKLGGLLKQFGLYDRVVLDVKDFEKNLDASIEYKGVNGLISEEQDKAKVYLDMVCNV